MKTASFGTHLSICTALLGEANALTKAFGPEQVSETIYNVNRA